MGAPQAKRRDLSLTMNGGDGSGAVRSAAGMHELMRFGREPESES
jgi:hypothetical protein